jgi:drug/metabolite transporter (DMT)-like permease
VLLIAATARADPSLVGAIVGTAPVALAVLGALQERRSPSLGVVFAAVVVALGAAVVEQARLAGDTVGVLLAVGAMLGEVGFSLLAVPVLRRIGPVAVSAHGTWLAAAMLAVGALIVDGSDALRAPTATEAVALIYLALVVTAAAFVMWYSAVDRLGADTAGLFAGLIPVSALATSVLIGTDQMTSIKLFGALIVGAGVVIGLGTRRRGAPFDTPEPV